MYYTYAILSVLIETACSTVWKNTHCYIPQETSLPSLKSHISFYSYPLLIRPWQFTDVQTVAFPLHVWEIKFWILGVARNTFSKFSTVCVVRIWDSK
jgi:hypothetical protein